MSDHTANSPPKRTPGLIGAFIAARAAVLVELRTPTHYSETDERFALLKHAAEHIARECADGDAGPVEIAPEFDASLKRVAGELHEPVAFVRGIRLVATEKADRFGQYVHHDGKTATLLHARGALDAQTMHNLCMHITAATPPPLRIDDEPLPRGLLEGERRAQASLAINAGLSAEQTRALVERALETFASGVSLLDQPFALDPSKTVRQVVGRSRVIEFVRWRVGVHG
jgi:elongation factor Ts